jgi:hypothetical protein
MIGRRAFLIALTLLGLICAAGCKKPSSSVSGTVKVKDGTPVEVGNVVFWDSEGHAFPAKLGKDGKFSFENNAPVGEVKVTIETPPPRPAGRQMDKPPPGMKGMPADQIPEDANTDEGNPGTRKNPEFNKKYKDKNDTPLVRTLTKGTNDDMNFELEP